MQDPASVVPIHSTFNLWRILELIVVLAVVQLVACGYSAPPSNAPAGTQVANGTVASVGLTSVNNGSGGLQSATAVVLTVPLGNTSVLLCGDQRAQFTMNSSVQVSYTNGTYCSELVSVQPM
jgi:hypothetical protein